MVERLRLADRSASWLESHLPPRWRGELTSPAKTRPHVTLTFATSLDSALSLGPGLRTRLSGAESKAMTHYLRSRHDAICIGVGTVLADDPALNCRLEGVGLEDQPRPIVIDPHGRWHMNDECKVLQVAREGQGLAPFVLTGMPDPPEDVKSRLEKHGGKFITLNGGGSHGEKIRFQWADILAAVHKEGLQAVMIEGGGNVINSLLEPAARKLIDSVIVTIAPTWLGQGGVLVSPSRQFDQDGRPVPALRLVDVAWHSFGEDAVLCGKIN